MSRRTKSRPNADLGNVCVEVTLKVGYAITKGDWHRFHNKVRWDGLCEIFESATSNDYGRFWINGEVHGAHHVSIFMHDCNPEYPYGFLPKDGQLKGIDVAHTCHNRACVRRDHLRLTSKLVNLNERDARQREDRSKEVHIVQSEGVEYADA